MQMLFRPAARDAAQRWFAFGCACAGALLIVDGGLSVFAFCLLAATLARALPAHAPVGNDAGETRLVAALVAALLLTGALSLLRHGLPLATLDNLARLALIPWCAWLARPDPATRLWLWLGALAGLLLAFVTAWWQIDNGLLRAGGPGNPIVFANLVLVLLVVVCFVSPADGWRLAPVRALAWCVAAITLVLSGSRGALPGLLAILAGAMLHAPGPWRRAKLPVLVCLLAGLALLLWGPFGLSGRLRLADIGPELLRYAHGDPDSPVGARLQLLALAWQAFSDHPWTGIGLQGLGEWVQALPGCARPQPMGMCVLGHAHNDLAEWAATLGLPGVLAIIALYAVPLALFVQLARCAGSAAGRGAAWAGAVLVVVYVMSGLTQSMFAHAASASAYGLFVGVLLGMAAHDGRRADELS